MQKMFYDILLKWYQSFPTFILSTPGFKMKQGGMSARRHLCKIIESKFYYWCSTGSLYFLWSTSNLRACFFNRPSDVPSKALIASVLDQHCMRHGGFDTKPVVMVSSLEEDFWKKQRALAQWAHLEAACNESSMSLNTILTFCET